MTTPLPILSITMDPTNWVPLEQFVKPAALPMFMSMGQAQSPDGLLIHSYKHCETRRSLHLDDMGQPYRYLHPFPDHPGFFVPIDAEDALEHVFS